MLAGLENLAGARARIRAEVVRAVGTLSKREEDTEGDIKDRNQREKAIPAGVIHIVESFKDLQKDQRDGDNDDHIEQGLEERINCRTRVGQQFQRESAKTLQNC